MGKTSSEVKNRWCEKTYKRYTALLRKEDDEKMIEWVEQNRDKYTIADIFRAGVETLMNN